MPNINAKGLAARGTTSAIDITGHENLMLLLPNPGDEIAYGPFISELCARGRPPFVVSLGDGAHDGSHALAILLERRSRKAISILGVPDDRILFVGLHMGSVPMERDTLFEALLAAMALLNWRKDCNVVAASGPTGNDVDRLATWQVAGAVAERNGLRLVAHADDIAEDSGDVWDFDGAAWLRIAANACEAHDGLAGGVKAVSRFHAVRRTPEGASVSAGRWRPWWSR